jgi:hypothetical protein
LRKSLLALVVAAAAVLPGVPAGHAAPAPAPVGPRVGNAHLLLNRDLTKQDAGLNVPCYFTASPGCTPIPLQYGTPIRQGNGGPVEVTSTNYLIYWEPAGSTVSSTYHTLINRFFDDVGGSTLYGTATQYYQAGGSAPQCGTVKTAVCTFITNSSTRGASWVDTGAFPTSYSTNGYLSDADIQNEVTHAMSVNGWTGGIGKEFFVFLPHGVNQCMDSSTCSFSTYCAYHSYFTSGSTTILYSPEPYVDTNRAACGYQSADFGLTGTVTGPNGDIAADEQISIASHELMETVTDPMLNAWYDASGYENGDKCAYTYGTIEPNGSRPTSNLTHNGHSYLVQLEWDNASAGCKG